HSAHAHVVVGFRNDELVGLDVLVKDELPCFGALDPQVLRHLALEDVADLRPHHIGDPVHSITPPISPNLGRAGATSYPLDRGHRMIRLPSRSRPFSPRQISLSGGLWQIGNGTAPRPLLICARILTPPDQHNADPEPCEIPYSSFFSWEACSVAAAPITRSFRPAK